MQRKFFTVFLSMLLIVGPWAGLIAKDLPDVDEQPVDHPWGGDDFHNPLDQRIGITIIVGPVDITKFGVVRGIWRGARYQLSVWAVRLGGSRNASSPSIRSNVTQTRVSAGVASSTGGGAGNQ